MKPNLIRNSEGDGKRNMRIKQTPERNRRKKQNHLRNEDLTTS